MPVRYEINYSAVNRVARARAYALMRLVVTEIRITAKRNATGGPYSKNQRLARSIYGTLRTAPNGYIARIGSELAYAASVEGGARPHLIRPKKPYGYLYFYWVKRGRWHRTRLVHHPGQRGKHYLRDALLRVAHRRRFRVVIYHD